LAGVRAAVHQALLQIRHIRIEHTALSPLKRPLRKYRSGGEFADGGPAHPQTTGNLQEWHILLMQRLDLVIACDTAVSGRLPDCLLPHRRQSQGTQERGPRWCRRSAHTWQLGQVRQLGVQAAEHPLKRFAMILEHVPAEGDLERSWGSVGGGAGILG
jgi:hypothetical protein